MNAKLNIFSAKEASAAIAGLARTNRDEVGPAIIHALSGLGTRALAPGVLLEIAEVLRPVVDDVIAEHRSRYTDRALPLEAEEAKRFGHAMALLGALESTYRRCYEAALVAPRRDLARKDLARALQRAMACVVAQMIEHYRARQIVGLALWKRLQQCMRIARREKLDAVEVRDAPGSRGTVTPLATYGRALLLAIAQPSAMTRRNLEATLLLTALYAHLVEPQMLDDDGRGERARPQQGTTGVGIQRSGRIRVVVVGGVTHLINTSRIDAALNRRVQLLQDGGNAAQTGLATLVQADWGDLLPRLRRIWCGGGEIRKTARRPLQERSAVAIGFREIYRFASPRPLVIPKEFEVYESGHAAPRAGAANVLAPDHQGNPIEIWHALDHSPSGMQARRPRPGARLLRGQLLAVYFNGMQQDSEFALAEVRWLQQFTDSDGGGIAAGIRFVSSDAGVAVVRVFGLEPGHYQTIGPAFVLNQSDPPQMVLPAGWFARGRKVDLSYQERLSSVELTGLRARGADYEIVGYAPIR